VRAVISTRHELALGLRSRSDPVLHDPVPFPQLQVVKSFGEQATLGGERRSEQLRRRLLVDPLLVQQIPRLSGGHAKVLHSC
jgi:hypothetical protein